MVTDFKNGTVPSSYDRHIDHARSRDGETKSERSVNQPPRSPNMNDGRPHAAHGTLSKVHSSESSDTEKDSRSVNENQNRDLYGSDPQAENSMNISAKDASTLASPGCDSARSVSGEGKENAPMLESMVTISPAAKERMNIVVDASVLVKSDTDADHMVEFGSSYEEPMVIEFTRSGSGDGAVIRAGNKRARVNSDSNLTEIIRQPFVQQPVTIYGIYIYICISIFLLCAMF